MATYRTVCPDCGHIRHWNGNKTRILEKTPEQLDQITKDEMTCAECGSLNAETESNNESEMEKINRELSAPLPDLMADTIIIDQIDEKTRSSF